MTDAQRKRRLRALLAATDTAETLKSNRRKESTSNEVIPGVQRSNKSANLSDTRKATQKKRKLRTPHVENVSDSSKTLCQPRSTTSEATRSSKESANRKKRKRSQKKGTQPQTEDNNTDQKQEAEENTTHKTSPPSSLNLDALRVKLQGSRFRWINEQLYTRRSEEAQQLFSTAPELFQVV